MTELIQRAEERFDITNQDIRSSCQAFLTVVKNQAGPLITWLRDREGFSHLILVTCVDWPEKEKMILHYLLHNYTAKQDLAVLVELDRDNPQMEDLHMLWAQMRTYQREMYEMFGINFPGSPGLTEPFCLEGWDNLPPMRRDFDTRKYSEETFFPRPGRYSEDPADHMRKKLYPGRAEL
jgi:NADH-quinone oxidoreductase subunit C